MNYKLLSLPDLVLGTTLILTLTGCTTLTAFRGQTTNDKLGRVSFCDAAEPITWSKKDTTRTVAQIKEHNAVGMELKCKKWE